MSNGQQKALGCCWLAPTTYVYSYLAVLFTNTTSTCNSFLSWAGINRRSICTSRFTTNSATSSPAQILHFDVIEPTGWSVILFRLIWHWLGPGARHRLHTWPVKAVGLNKNVSEQKKEKKKKSNFSSDHWHCGIVLARQMAQSLLLGAVSRTLEGIVFCFWMNAFLDLEKIIRLLSVAGDSSSHTPAELNAEITSLQFGAALSGSRSLPVVTWLMSTQTQLSNRIAEES